MKFSAFFIVSFFSVLVSQAQILINEVQSSNNYFLKDEFGEYTDWFELFNNSSVQVNLLDWFVSDSKKDFQKWQFPDIIMEPESYVLVHASGRDIKQSPVYWKTIIQPGDTFQYIIPGSEPDAGWRNTGFDAGSWSKGKASFGYGDGDDSTVVATGTQSVFVRKTFNIEDKNAIEGAMLHIDYDDAFIAYLNGQEIARENLPTTTTISYNTYATIDREGEMWSGGDPDFYTITNAFSILNEGENVLAIQVHNVSATSSDLSLIPFLSLSYSSPVAVNENDRLNLPISAPHTNFKLKSGGEAVYLSNPDSVLIDSMESVVIPTNASYGILSGSAQKGYFQTPTPGAENGSAGFNLVDNDTIEFSQSGGFYSSAFNLSLSSNIEGAIYYTTDGTDPDTTKTLYTSPINITATSIIKARLIVEGYLQGKAYATSFIFDRKPDIPVICLNTEPELLWDDEVGMYVLGNSYEDWAPYYGANFWNDWEYPFNFTYFDKEGNQIVSQGIGVKIFGGWSRANAQRSMALFARKQYGKGTIDNKFFEELSLESFSSLILRNSGNDWGYTHFRDGLMTGLVSHLGLDHQAFQPVAVYLNNEYWGIYNLREKLNEDFLAAHHDLNADDINILEGKGDVVEGTNYDYLEFLDFLDINTTIQSDEAVQTLTSTIDLDNYIKYQLSQIYFDNGDWPGNNIKFWKSIAPGSKWKWILYDTDFGFTLYKGEEEFNFNTINFATDTWGPDWPNPPWSTLLFRRVLTNEAMRHNFINQMADNINTSFLGTTVTNRVDEISSEIQSEMVYHTTRWEMDYGNWENQVSKLKYFGNNRPNAVRYHLMNSFSLPSMHQVTVDVSNDAAGYIQLNTLELHNLPFSGKYFKTVPITISAIPNPGYKFTGWTGVSTSTETTISIDLNATSELLANFEEVDNADINLVINEINYNSGLENNSGDWVEIYNPSSATYDISGVYLTELDGLSEFTFPEGTILTAKSYIVVARDLDQFSLAYPSIENVVGDLPFGLSSDGDELRLYNSDGSILDAVDYLPFSPWPELANGQGYTLELISSDLDNGQPGSWKSQQLGGTPGKVNSTENVSIAGNSTPTKDRLEIFPTRFSDFTTINFSLSSGSDIKIEVVDLQGRVVFQSNENNLSEGNYTIDWKPETGIPAGIYTVICSSVNTKKTARVVYIK